MKQKHTPSPWTIGSIIEEKTKSGNIKRTDPVYQAAPELLEALIELRKLHDHGYGSDILLDKCDEAIAKAMGGAE